MSVTQNEKIRQVTLRRLRFHKGLGLSQQAQPVGLTGCACCRNLSLVYPSTNTTISISGFGLIAKGTKCQEKGIGITKSACYNSLETIKKENLLAAGEVFSVNFVSIGQWRYEIDAYFFAQIGILLFPMVCKENSL